MSRKLKVEERGDYHAKQTVPMVRLKGKWLQRAGFPAGSHVQINVYAPGCLDIRLIGGAP
jgi:hypothetical protein